MLYHTCRRSLQREVRAAALPVSLLGLAACFAAAPVVVSAQDETTPQIIRVEEDWVLDVAAPQPEANVPQVMCVFGPEDPNNSTHAVFEINHGTAPSFQSGGMQLQCWWQDYLLGFGNHPNNREFDAAVDTITFTTLTELKNNRLYLEIINGHSVNWGSFGGEGYLRQSLETWRHNLNSYNPNQSIKHSRITYGKHRVNRYARTEVRYYTADGLLRTEGEDAVIFAQDNSTGEEEAVAAASAGQ